MPDKTDMAENRTAWAEDRTLLANERTFAGWMRTGMAAVAVALGLQALFRDFQPTWVPKLVAELFILAAILIFAAAYANGARTQKRLDAHDADRQNPRRIGIIATVLTIAAAGTGIILWLL